MKQMQSALAFLFRNFLWLTAVAILFPNAAIARVPDCNPLGMGKDALVQLKAKNWVIEDAARRNSFAIGLTKCLGDPDPEIRDGIATEAITHYLRGRLLSQETMLALSEIFQTQLMAVDEQGFLRPFAALNLSEIARTDRVEPYLTTGQRGGIVNAAVQYMNSINDYRDFDPAEGYRHGVAHASDLMMQLALNPAIGKAELITMRDALAIQIAPASHSYVTGESERLARPILFMAQRDIFTEDEWNRWFNEITGPATLGSWDGWFLSKEGLARRHNLMVFLSVLYTNVSLGKSRAFAALVPAMESALKALP